MENQQLIARYESAVKVFMNTLAKEYDLKRDELDQLWENSLSEVSKPNTKITEPKKDIIKNGDRKLVESKMIKDKPEQKAYFEEFCKRLITKKYRGKLVEYLFHIHPDDRWDFMEKIKKKKLTERRTYIENLFSMDEDIEELEKEKYGTEEKLNEYENKNKEIREHKDLYDFEKNFKSKSLIYQAFLKKIREQDPRNRSLIYLFFVGISDIGKQQKKNPVETRQLVWTNFFTYVSKLKTEEKRNFINLLFNDDFDLYKYVQE